MNLRLDWANFRIDMSQRTHIMGILNITPDSFSDGGRYMALDKAVEHALEMVEDGADIIDVGGESTRPYAQKISAMEEMDRVLPVIEALKKEIRIPISIDTCKADVASRALQAGASIINDISALNFDINMASLAAESEVPVILMHMQGTPRDMQVNPIYQDLIIDILNFFNQALKKARSSGIKEELIIVDPGIGFGKSFDDNLKIINQLKSFTSLKRPVLIGPSDKAFIGKILNKEPGCRTTGTMAAIAAGIMNGAHIVRVHNVKKAVETARIIDAIKHETL